MRLSLAPVDLAELLRLEVELFRGQSTEHELLLELPADLLEVVGDRERLAQVVANLLSNAIKYSPEGGRVAVAVAEVDGAARVSVADSGLGIPREQQTRIFEKFFRVDTSDIRQIGGTGLGLALCKEIVDAHGGRIGFESIEGRGSTFWFELPAGARRRARDGTRILVVEDDPAEAALLSDWLAGEGFEVEVVGSGEDALASAARRRPDAVCLDIRLAGELDGWDVLARLKGAAATADVPVVICTGGNGRDRAASLGASDFLTKPFSPAVLRAAVERLLPDRRGNVLVVDDDPAIRRLVAEALAHGGVELREAASGEEALAEVERARPNAIVLDLVMPGIDGFEVLERLQDDPAARMIPVLVLTAHDLTPDERALLRRRAVAVLEKSAYSAAELVGLVERALGR
jgi:CheY-like chemotaxis protein/anti-sigma regulatory factor (Ser/Thr protein kinase)